jgi:hypothetical protein
MESAYTILIAKLEEFIRKYYKNKIIRGGLYAITTLFAFYLLINILEYFAYFPTVVRATLFWSFIIINAYIIVAFILIPVFNLFKIGKRLSHEQAALVIGRHFSEVSDVLLNVLQLKQLSESRTAHSALLEAAIDQKIQKLRPVPFTAAIDLSKNRKYLKFALPPVMIVLVLLITAPSTITGPSKRILDYGTFYEKPAPFTFSVLNQKLEAVQQEEFVLDVKLTGDEIPDEVTIVIGEARYRLSKENNTLFHYTFKNLQKSTDFYLSAGDYRSKDYKLKVVARPIILNFEMALEYPAYLHKQNEIVENSGDVVVPEGTRVSWKLKTKDTKLVGFRMGDRSVSLKPVSSDFFIYSQVCKESMAYSVKTQNDFFGNKDSMEYVISVVADQYPGIDIQNFKDSVYDQRLYFSGNIHDDYGCSALKFRYRLLKKGESDSKGEDYQYQNVPFNIGTTQQQFYYFFDLGSLSIEPGDEVEYFFEVWDNDGVNGHKSTRSQRLVFKAPTLQELQEQTEKSNEQIKDQLQEAIRQSQQLQRELDKLDKKLTDKKTLNWQEKKDIQDMLDRQQNLQLQIEQLKLENQKNNIRENEYKQTDPELLEKQQQLEKLFNEVMTDEMKEMFKKLQEMMDKLEKRDVNEMIDKMKLTNEDLKKELDRNLELFKQLEFEKKMDETIQKLDQLSEEQKKLAEESKNNKENSEALQKKQEELNKEFDQVKKDLDDLQKKNSELEKPNKLENTDDKENSIDQQMKQSTEQLQKGKNSNASKSQQQASEEMEELSKQLQSNKEEMEESQAGEDIQTLRQILENLVYVSFTQEDVMNELKKIQITDPKYIKLMEKQKQLQDQMKMISDSLYALSKRQPMIESFVNREMSTINDNMKKTLQSLHNRTAPATANYQQYVMTSVNNLALMLAESLKQMQEQQNQKSGSQCKSGNCKKPGQGKPSAASMKALQEQLNKQMQQLKDQMEGKNPGKQGSGQSMSEQLARLAAQQEALRRMLQEYGEEDKKSGGKNSGNISEMTKQMEQTEQDLVNKMITNETLKRQQDILTRLLESEKAEKERELDEKRESNEAKNQNYSNPNAFFQYKRLKQQDTELLKTVPPALNSFYKQKVNEYFYNFVE